MLILRLQGLVSQAIELGTCTKLHMRSGGWRSQLQMASSSWQQRYFSALVDYGVECNCDCLERENIPQSIQPGMWLSGWSQ